MRNFIAALMMCLLLTSCIGDGGFGITGKVESASGTPLQGCKLQLGVDAPDLVTYYTREFAPPEFSESFTVAPSEAPYPLTVSCVGHIRYKTIIKYGTVVSAGEHVNLGTIALEGAVDGT